MIYHCPEQFGWLVLQPAKAGCAAVIAMQAAKTRPFFIASPSHSSPTKSILKEFRQDVNSFCVDDVFRPRVELSPLRGAVEIFAAALADGAGRVRYVHLSESDRGVPGSGNVDCRGAPAALKRADYSGDLALESFVAMPPQLAAALSVWRPVARDAEEALAVGAPYVKSLAQASGLIAT